MYKFWRDACKQHSQLLWYHKASDDLSISIDSSLEMLPSCMTKSAEETADNAEGFFCH